MLQHYEKWKEAPVDAFILGLYRLQVYYYNEIQRGYGGIGSYTLSPEFEHEAIAVDEIMALPAIQPAKIVAKIRNNQFVVSYNDCNDCQYEDCDVTVAADEDSEANFANSSQNHNCELSSMATSMGNHPFDDEDGVKFCGTY